MSEKYNITLSPSTTHFKCPSCNKWIGEYLPYCVDSLPLKIRKGFTTDINYSDNYFYMIDDSYPRCPHCYISLKITIVFNGFIQKKSPTEKILDLLDEYEFTTPIPFNTEELKNKIERIINYERN